MSQDIWNNKCNSVWIIWTLNGSVTLREVFVDLLEKLRRQLARDLPVYSSSLKRLSVRSIIHFSLKW